MAAPSQPLVDDELRELEALDDAIERWIETLRHEAENVDAEQIAALLETAKIFAIKLDEELPPRLGPAAIAEIRGILLGAIRKMSEEEDLQPLDLLDDFLLRAESIRHIVRDVLDEHLGREPEDPQALMQLLDSWLPRVPRKALADLLDVDVRTIQRWAAGEKKTAPRRLYIVTQLAAILRSAWTPEGVIAWFNRERPDLGARPRDVLDDPGYEQRLLASAREGRAQHGS